MKNRKTEYCKMAREAVLQGDRYFGQRDYRGASVFYLKASQLGSKEGNKKYRQVQELLGDSDLVNPAQYAKNQKKNYVTLESPKMKASLSIPSEEPRTLIEDCGWSQQEPRKQQEKQNKTVEKPKIEKEQGNNADELLKKAQELETKGKKKESFLLLKKAADCGSERAKAELGQKYLKLAIKYLGRDVAFEMLGAKVTSSRKDDKTETSTALKPHFRHQRNRIAELNGCGDMAETETSVLHAEKAEETTWVGEEKKDNPPPPEVIIQEIVRYVAYWSGTDCLPNLMFVDCPEPELWKCTMKSGHEFSETSVMMLVDCTAVTRKEEAPLPMPSEEKQKEQASKPSIKDSFYRVFRNIFTIFKR